MLIKEHRLSLLIGALALAPLAIASYDPIKERHELMEGVGEAAEPIGLMLRGEREYDAEVLITSLVTFRDASEKFGELFPEGSETGGDTEAAPAIWEDRAGFDEALAMWRDATVEAIESRPKSLEAARPVVGPVFNSCKNCHDGYRIDTD